MKDQVVSNLHVKRLSQSNISPTQSNLKRGSGVYSVTGYWGETPGDSTTITMI